MLMRHSSVFVSDKAAVVNERRLPFTTDLLRHINARRCLRVLRRNGAMSRATIARELHLTRATIGLAVRELLESNLVVEVSEQVSEGKVGRPGTLLTINPHGAYFAGIDVGTMQLTGVLLDLDMKVVAKTTAATGPDARNIVEVTKRLVTLLNRLVAKSGLDSSRIHDVSISIPGLVDHDGRVVVAPFLGWQDVPLRELVQKQLGRRWTVAVCNDAVAFAVAECAVSTASDTENLLVVLLAEGIGSALVQQGHIVAGAHGYLGEVGHMVLGSRLASESSRAFELLAGSRLFRRFLSKNIPIADTLSGLLDGRRKTASLEPVLGEWAEYLAIGFLNLIHILDPGRIVLGGPLTVLFPLVEARVVGLLSKHLLHGFTVPPIGVTRFGADGAAIGAAAQAREAVFALPELHSGTAARSSD
jgi:predicted NBD/HSP70 family sugar kinase